jgi:hypothetical protein
MVSKNAKAAAGYEEDNQKRKKDPKAFTQDRNDFWSFGDHDFQKSMIKAAMYGSLATFFLGCLLTGFGFWNYLYLKIYQAFASNWLLYPLIGMVTALLVIFMFLFHRHKR